MIPLVRLNGCDVVLNAELIVTVESTPDTLLTLTTGHQILVRESVEEVVARVMAYRQRIHIGPTVVEGEKE